MPVQVLDRDNNSYFSADVMLMGGFSIFVCLLSWALMDKGTSVYTVSQLGVALAFIVNDPHFLASYVLLYKDQRREIFKNRSLFWAAVVVPVILGGVIAAALWRADARLMAHIITGMFFLVGWHYVKQIFGCIIVTSSQRGLYYKDWQKQLLLFNLFCTWFMSWVGPHVQSADFDYYGISHYALNLPGMLLTGSYWAVGLSLLAVVWMQWRIYVEEGKKPSPPGVAAFVAIYAWYLPLSQHPGFAYLIPFFHSLQYLPFVWALKRNHVQSQIGHLEGREWRAAWSKMFIGYMLTVVFLGVMSFEVVPYWLDERGWIPQGVLGTNPILVGVLLFINIHHYFIDNVIWRSHNQFVKSYLFQTPALRAVPQQHTSLPAKAG